MPEKNKVSLQSKTFVILFTVALVGTYLCLVYSQKMTGRGGLFGSFFFYGKSLPYNPTGNDETAPTTTYTNDVKSVDTTDWKTFNSAKYGFTMLCPPLWNIRNLGVQGEYYILEIRPTASANPISLHINRQNFRALEGLPSETEKLNGDELVNIKGQLYGLKHDIVHITFDLGANLSQEAEFQAMVHSVKFQ